MTSGHTLVAVILALGAAASFAISNVVQMGAVRRQPARERLDTTLVARVARDPRWLAGLAASIFGFVLEAAALSLAPVVLVQPLIVAELPFALPLAAAVAGRRLGAREWTGIAMVSAGLVAVVAVIRPNDKPIEASGTTWVILVVSVAAIVAALLTLTANGSGIVRTSGYAASAGLTFGLLAVVTKATTRQFTRLGIGSLATWQPWALAVIGLVGMTLAQNAYRAGPLAVSLPLLDIGEPLSGSVIAIAAFGERLGRLTPVSTGFLVVAVVVVVLGITVLDRSPLVRAAQSTIRGEQLPTRAC